MYKVFWFNCISECYIALVEKVWKKKDKARRKQNLFWISVLHPGSVMDVVGITKINSLEPIKSGTMYCWCEEICTLHTKLKFNNIACACLQAPAFFCMTVAIPHSDYRSSFSTLINENICGIKQYCLGKTDLWVNCTF